MQHKVTSVSEILALVDYGFGIQGPRTLFGGPFINTVQVVAQLIDHGVNTDVRNHL